MGIEASIGRNDQISEEAAERLVEFRTGEVDCSGRGEFDAWLRASPEHIRAFIEMAALWVEGGAIDPRRRLDVEEIIARAQGDRNIAGLTEALEEALRCMAPRVQATFLLHRRDGLTMDQVSERLGISRPMAKNYLVKALVQFRRRLKESD